MIGVVNYTDANVDLAISGDTFMSMVAESKKPVPWLFEDFIVEGDQIMIAGASKAGKSWLALQFAVTAATGGKFLRWQAARPLKTCYINLEVGRHMWSRRVVKQVPDALAAVCNENFVSVNSLKTIDVLNPKQLQQMQRYIKENGFELVVIDVLSRCHSVDENVNGEMKRVLFALRAMCCGAASVVVHHARKPPAGAEHASLGPSAIRGASSIVGEVDMAMIFTVRAGQGARYSLEIVARNIEAPDEMLLDRDDESMLYSEHQGQENNLDDIIQTLFKGGHSLPRKDVQQAVADGLGVTFETARKTIKSAIERGLIEESRQGRNFFYFVPDASPILRVANAYAAASNGEDCPF